MNIYQEQILDHYQNPRNIGKPENFTHMFKMQNLSCGDEVTTYILVENKKVKSIHHLSEGCSITIATASILSEFLLNKTPDEIQSMDEQYLYDLLGISLSPSRTKCALIALESIQKALSITT